MSRRSWNRTKIVTTLGPATSSCEAINRLAMSGVDVMRLNLSHGTIKGYTKKIKMVRAISEKIGRPYAGYTH